jgi:NAD(P)-dependent dehydrogenase (short-subunit alcohol dehydrogenase family)
VTGVQGDVSNPGDLDRLFAQIKREKGRIDIVFANAGVAKYARLGTITEELYEGPSFHGAEGASADPGWWLHHPECVHRRQQRFLVE